MMTLLRSRFVVSVAGVALAWPVASLHAQVTIPYSSGQTDDTSYSTTAPNSPTTLSIASGTATQSGALTGTGNLIKDGAGTLILTGGNTVSGTTTISAGTLSFTGGSGLPNSAVTLEAGATLFGGNFGSYTLGGFGGAGAVSFTYGGFTFGSNNASTSFSGSLSGSGTLTKAGTGTFTFNGSSTGGQLAVSGGTLIFAPSSAANYQGPVMVQSGGTATIAPPDPSRFVGSVSVSNGGSATIALPNSIPLGATEVSVSSGGTLTLGGTYKATALANTTLVVASGATINLPEVGVVLGGLSNPGGGTITITPTGFFDVRDLTIGANNISSSFGGNLVFTGSPYPPTIMKVGTGTLTLTSTTNFAPEVKAGYVALYSDAGGSDIRLQGGGLRYNTAMTHTGVIVGQTGGGSIDTGSNAVTLSGPLYGGSTSEADTLNKIGAGTLTLTGSSTNFYGKLAINEGTVGLGGASSGLPNGAVSIAAGATLFADRISYVDPGGSYTIGGLSGTGTVSLTNSSRVTFGADNANSTFSGSLTGSGGLTKTGTGTFTFNGTSNGTELAVNGGTMLFAPSSAATYTGGVIAYSGGTVVVAPPDPAKFTGSLWLAGGAITLSLPNSTPLAASEINASAGTVTLGETYKATALSATRVNLYGSATFSVPGEGAILGTLDASGGTFALTGSYSSNRLTIGANNLSSGFGGPVSVAEGKFLEIIKVGSGTWSLYDSLTRITPRIQAGYAVLSPGAGNVSVVLENGGLRYGSAMTHAGIIQLYSHSHGTVDTGSNDVTLSGGINSLYSTDSLTKIGSGTLTVSGNMAGGSSMFFGVLRINAGTVAVSQNSNLGYDFEGFSSALSLGGGTLRATASFASGHAVAVTSGGGAFDVVSGATLTWNGPVSGIGTLTKLGDGKLLLGGMSTHGGAMTVSAGTLQVSGSFGASAIAVDSGGTLSGSGTVGAVTVASGGTFSPGASPGLLTVNGDLSLTGAALMELAGTGRGTTYDATNVLGSITFGGTLNVSLLGGYTPTAGATFNLFDWTGGASGTFATVSLPDLGEGLIWNDSALYTSGVLRVTSSAIPEPSTYAAIFGLGALGSAIWRRRRPKQR